MRGCVEMITRYSEMGQKRDFMRLIAENLGGERGGERLFSGLDFTVSAGEALLVTGPNGAGKSTLLRIIAGLLIQAEGMLRLEAAPVAFEGLVAATHYLGHLNAMKPVLSVDENLRFWQSFNGTGQYSIAEALERVSLGDIGHLPFGYLSTGQKRRASIARLLLSDRPVWLLDEPTAGLDKASEVQFAGLMQEHLKGGGIIVAATHLPLGLGGGKELALGATV
jgi:heme exporter protein A